MDQLIPTANKNVPYQHTMGSIVTWAIIRAAIVIVLSLVLYEYVQWIDYSVWWMLSIAALFAAVLYPAQIQYRLYKEGTKNIVTHSLCSSCKHFEPTAVMCSVLDEHVTEAYIPCEGLRWEPSTSESDSD